jgi:hypothetical protein
MKGTRMPATPDLEFICTLTLNLDPPTRVGNTPHGHRQIIPITGGTLEGEKLSGSLRPGGADWFLVRPDGVGELDVRTVIETSDGSLIYVAYRGLMTNVPAITPRWMQGEEVPRDEYAFAVTMEFETRAENYVWLQQRVVVGVGTLVPGGRIRYDVYAVN